MRSLPRQKPLWSSGYDTHRRLNTTNYRGLFGRLQFKSGHGHIKLRCLYKGQRNLFLWFRILIMFDKIRVFEQIYEL